MAVTPPPAAAGEPLHASYATYAAGLQVGAVAAAFALGPWTYQIQVAYHTTGLLGLFDHGQEADSAHGTWQGGSAAPMQFIGQGTWRGEQRQVELDYQQGIPTIRRLVPANDTEREPVPEALRGRTIDSLSALAHLIHVVATTGRCDTVVRTFDGRRLSEVTARTVGEENLPKTDRSTFAGPALRCDFEGRLLAGFKTGHDHERDGRPMHGSAWIAAVGPGGEKLPVRLTFETHWFGEATMYLTEVGKGADLRLAEGGF